jgi:hypothetical protein
MKRIFKLLVVLYLFSSCSVENDFTTDTNCDAKIRPISLGTVTPLEKVFCETCRFPAQLSKKLGDLHPKIHIPIKLLQEQAGLQPTCFHWPLKILPITI